MSRKGTSRAVSCGAGARRAGACAISSGVGSGPMAAIGWRLGVSADQSSSPSVENGMRTSGGTSKASRLGRPMRAVVWPGGSSGSMTELSASGFGRTGPFVCGSIGFDWLGFAGSGTRAASK